MDLMALVEIILAGNQQRDAHARAVGQCAPQVGFVAAGGGSFSGAAIAEGLKDDIGPQFFESGVPFPSDQRLEQIRWHGCCCPFGDECYELVETALTLLRFQSCLHPLLRFLADDELRARLRFRDGFGGSVIAEGRGYGCGAFSQRAVLHEEWI